MEESALDAIGLLNADHDQAKQPTAELEDTTERAVKTREQKWTKLRKQLTINENVEVEVFYPALAEHPKAKAIVLEALEECGQHPADRSSAR